MFIKKGNIPCDYIKVSKIISDILVEMGSPLLSIDDDGFYYFAYSNDLKERVELLLIEYGGILERSIING